MLIAADIPGIVGNSKTDQESVARAAAPWAPSAEAPRPPFYAHVKTVLEWSIALILLVLASPLLVLLAALVKLTSPGPAIYAQSRLGRHGRLYRIFKLRTMVQHAETGTGPVWAEKEDRRITRLGRVLRDTHLDELPQLWNVLCGQMSLIGPRPERPEIAARVTAAVPEFSQRLALRPGVTGLAQMLLPADDPNDPNNGYRGVRRKLAHDLYYVQRVGFMLDLRIALCTTFYFIAAAIDSLRHSLVRSYKIAVQRTLDEGEESQKAA